MRRWGAHLRAGGFEKVGVKEQDADGGVAMMKVSKKMDMSLVLKPERWAPGGSVRKAEFFQRFVSKRKRAPSANSNSLDLFFFCNFGKLERNTTQLNKEQGKTDILTKHHFCWSSSCLWF